jgi:hypothetical protein
MEKNYKIRTDAKAINDTTKDQLTKLTINSVIGYCAKKPNEKTQICIWKEEDDNNDSLNKHSNHSIALDFGIHNENGKKRLITSKPSTKAKSVITSPFPVSFSVLQLSKLKLYEFFYALKDHYNDNIALLYTDTDSLYLEIKTDDAFEEISTNKTLTSFIDQSKPGKFKNEIPEGDQITEFVAITAKTYSYNTEKKTVTKMAGIAKQFLPSIDKFKQCINDELTEQTRKVAVSIEIKEKETHEVHRVHKNYDSFKGSNIKVYQIDNLNSLPYGHYRIASI